MLAPHTHHVVKSKNINFTVKTQQPQSVFDAAVVSSTLPVMQINFCNPYPKVYDTSETFLLKQAFD